MILYFLNMKYKYLLKTSYYSAMYVYFSFNVKI